MKKNYLIAFMSIWLFSACTRNSLDIGSACHREIEDEVFVPNYQSFVTADKSLNPSSDETAFQGVITDEISRQMKVRGYKNSEENPNLIVFYALFPSEINLSVLQRTFRGLGKQNMSEELKRLKLRKGTLVLQVIENATNRPIWMGYAAGLSDPQTLNIDENSVRVATRQIFDQYKIFAKGYIPQEPVRRYSAGK
jgi:hypothetical protein